jgi:alpha-mannosidase
MATGALASSAVRLPAHARDANILPMAHSVAHPPIAFATNAHEGAVTGDLSLATFGSPHVVPSALHRSDETGRPIIRVYSASDAPSTASLSVPAVGGAATRVDLLDEPTGQPGGWDFPLKPGEIGSVTFGRPTSSEPRTE